MKDAHGPPVTLDYDTWPLTNTPIWSIADQGVCALTWSDDFIRRDRYRAGDLLAFDNRRVLHGCDGYDTALQTAVVRTFSMGGTAQHRPAVVVNFTTNANETTPKLG